MMFCADEATSGLDCYMAEGVVKQLKLLAQQGKTVLTTIHQPSPATFALFDDVILLSEGKMVYHGPISSLAPYLASHGFNCPMYTNLADFAINVLSTQSRDGNEMETQTKVLQVRKLTDAWALKNQQLHAKELEELLSHQSS